jgi:UDP-N-acetylglucosamine 1-carboxyvinyltransferase
MKLIELLEVMGVTVGRVDSHTFTFEAKQVNLEYLLTDDFKRKVVPCEDRS